MTSDASPRADLDLDATEAHCRQGWHVAPATAMGLVAMVREKEAEVERLTARCGFLQKQWVCAAAIMYGDPETLSYSQAYQHVTKIISAALAKWDREHPAGGPADE
jgi:hypothetical protein